MVATDPESGVTALKTVVATIIGQGTKHLVEITVDIDGDKGGEEGTLIATDGHPFWVPDLDEWLDAGDLKVGQRLQTPVGTLLQITALSQSSENAQVHNLTVDDVHTYYVLAGDTSVLVHNTGGCINFVSKGAGRDLRRTAEIDGETWRFNTGHGFNRPHEGPSGMNDLRTTALTPDQVETAIARDVNAFRASGGQVPFQGRRASVGPSKGMSTWVVPRSGIV